MTRIERIERSKHKQGRVLVFLEDGGCLKVTDREVLDFGLRKGDELSDAALASLKEAAGVSDVRAMAAALICKRALSRAALERKLREKGAGEEELLAAADWLESIGALDDAAYAAAVVRHCADKGYGRAKMREKLYEKGVPRELWDEAMEQAPAGEEAIEQYIRSKLKGRIPDEKEKKRLIDALLRRGFSWGDVRRVFGRVLDTYFEDDY